MTTHDDARLELAHRLGFAPAAGQARRAALTSFADTYLTEKFADALERTKNPMLSEHTALALVGSYARGEGGPLSDYDLVLLYDASAVNSGDVRGLAEKIWYPLWDDAVRFDHSVRTPAQCARVASEDLVAALGLLDLRHVAGNEILVSQTRDQIHYGWRSGARRRLPDLLEHIKTRHERVGDITTAQAPNLKDSAGGLRDAVIMGAMATAWLTDAPRQQIEPAYEHLLNVRDALHAVSNKGRETLLVEERTAVADLMGYATVDELLRDTVDSARTVSYVFSGVLRRSTQSQQARRLRVGPRRPKLTPVGYGLSLHDGEIVLSAGATPGGLLHLWRASYLAAKLNTPISPLTLRNLIASCTDLTWNDEVRDTFVTFLAAGDGVVATWEALDRNGAISAVLPQWEPIRSRPQRNAIHTYTVDRHSIETVVRASRLVGRVERPDLLLVAALLHDIGKQEGIGSHSIEGARIASAIARDMGFSSSDVYAISTLVREHLTLGELATRRDPQDPATVAALLAAVNEDAHHLTLLAALSEADARATSEAAWTPWRARLIEQLTSSARTVLRSGEMRPLSSLADVLPRDVSVSDVEAIRQGRTIVRVTPRAWGATLLTAAQDRDGFFADCVAAIARAGGSIRRASVVTLDGIAANTWDVALPLGDHIDATRVRQWLQTPRASTARSVGGGSSRKPGDAPRQAAVRALPEASTTASVIEVRADDRFGLLGTLAEAIRSSGVRVRSAHVETLAGHTIDTFYLTDADGGALSDATRDAVMATLRSVVGAD